MARELRFAIRGLIRARGFTALAVLTLAVGMTLCTAAAAAIKAYLLTGLPYPAADRLYWIRYAQPDQDQPRTMEKLDWSSLSDVIEHPVAWDLDMFYLLGGEYAESAPGAWVTDGFVRGLGIQPAIGRGFDARSFVPGGPNVAIISHRLWTTRFAGDPSILGSSFAAYVSDRPHEAETFTIIGVMPPSFWHFNPYTDILAPLRAPTYPYMARLRSGVSPAEAAARITALVRAGGSALPADWSVRVESAHDVHVAQVRRPLTTVGIAATLVLLVGCGNVAGLLLVRWARRQREIAVRAALGAGRGAISRMLIAEGALIAGAATVVAVLASLAILSWLAPIAQQQLGRSAPGGADAFAIDVRVVAFVAAAGTLTAVLCSLVPITALLRPGLLALNVGGRGASDGPRSRRTRNALIAVQIAASLTLLCGASVMFRSVQAMLRVDLGFDDDRVITSSLTLRQNRYPDAAAWSGAFMRILDALQRTPAVESVGLTNVWPVQQPSSVTVTSGVGGTARAGVHGITAGYFDVLRIRVTAGRPFAPADRAGAEDVAIVSETLARRLAPGANVVGTFIDVPRPADRGAAVAVRRRIVGIASDVRQEPGDNDLMDVYVPMVQAPTRFAVLMVRTSGSPLDAIPVIRQSVREVDTELALDRIRPLQTITGALVSRPRFMTSLLTALAIAAAILAVVGLYGVIAYAVRQREREIAVRLAVGASPRQIVALFMSHAVRLIAAGLALGLVLTLVASRLIESELFGVSARDPIALAMAATAFSTAALLAVWHPARRAATTDPAVALRSE